jgi:hypothetical protein
MVKCPFCQFDNEDGALFCEQCKSDLGSVQPSPPPVPPPVPPLMPEAVPMAAVVEEPPMAAIAPPPPIPDFLAPPPVPPPPPIPDFLEPPPLLHEPPTPPPPPPVMEPPPPPPVAVAPPPPPPPVAVEPPPPVAPPPPPPPPVAVAPPPPAPVAPPPPPPTPVAAAPVETGRLAADAKPRLFVMRGQKINQEFPIYEGHNFIGRADEKPVDIDLEDQEPPEKVWCSRQHALINFEDGTITIEDLNSANGTYVNRARIYPGQKRQLNVNDVIQIGTVHLKVKI